MLVHELHIRQLIGPERLRVLVDSWLKANVPPGQLLRLAVRRGHVLV